MIDAGSPLSADYLATAFARLGQIVPDQSDIYFGMSFRMAGPSPSLDELTARVAARVDHLPRLKERLVCTDTVRWEPDPDFDVAHHVRELPQHGDVLPARSVLAGHLDEARPPWSLWLAPSEPDGWQLYYLVHHARQDAPSAVRTVLSLLADDEPTTCQGQVHRRSTHGLPGLVALAPDLVQSYLPMPHPAPIQYGPGRVMAHEAVPLDWLMDVARRTGASVNNVHLAAMSAALDNWMPTRPRQPRTQFLVPVDTKRAGERDDGFTVRLGLFRVPLPSGLPGPADRLRELSAAVSRRRVARHRRGWRDLAENASPRMAGWALGRITAPTRMTVTVSSIRVDQACSILDTPVCDITAIPWLPPVHMCFALLVSYAGQARLSVLSPEGAPDPAKLVTRWRAAVQELNRAVTAPTGK
jgi:hypothetical protein